MQMYKEVQNTSTGEQQRRVLEEFGSNKENQENLNKENQEKQNKENQENYKNQENGQSSCLFSQESSIGRSRSGRQKFDLRGLQDYQKLCNAVFYGLQANLQPKADSFIESAYKRYKYHSGYHKENKQQGGSNGQSRKLKSVDSQKMQEDLEDEFKQYSETLKQSAERMVKLRNKVFKVMNKEQDQFNLTGYSKSLLSRSSISTSQNLQNFVIDDMNRQDTSQSRHSKDSDPNSLPQNRLSSASEQQSDIINEIKGAGLDDGKDSNSKVLKMDVQSMEDINYQKFIEDQQIQQIRFTSTLQIGAHSQEKVTCEINIPPEIMQKQIDIINLQYIKQKAAQEQKKEDKRFCLLPFPFNLVFKGMFYLMYPVLIAPIKIISKVVQKS